MFILIFPPNFGSCPPAGSPTPKLRLESQLLFFQLDYKSCFVEDRILIKVSY